jgi:hypothetical protein
LLFVQCAWLLRLASLPRTKIPAPGDSHAGAREDKKGPADSLCVGPGLLPPCCALLTHDMVRFRAGPHFAASPVVWTREINAQTELICRFRYDLSRRGPVEREQERKKPMPVYRRNLDDDVWHWAPDCPGWSEQQLMTPTPPNMGTLCPECKRLDGDTYAQTIAATRRNIKDI